MSDVQMVYRSWQPGCGINLFSRRLGAALARRDFHIRQCNLIHQSFESGTDTIIHYVPSMWAGDEGALESLLARATREHVVVILHGMYGPREKSYLKDVLCPELRSHVRVLGYGAQTIVALSQSCNDAWRQWDRGDCRAKLMMVYHPGAPRSIWTDLPDEPYLFLGGISRPKKDILTERLRGLLLAYSRDQVKVWVHISNPSQLELDLPVWRLTTGLLSDDEWFNALARAAAVLCPYETRIQCVSGVMIEAISLGTRVISTNFPFAREMKREHPELVHIEDDLLEWGALQLREKPPLAPSHVPTWEEFADKIASEMNPERSSAQPHLRVNSP